MCGDIWGNGDERLKNPANANRVLSQLLWSVWIVLFCLSIGFIGYMFLSSVSVAMLSAAMWLVSAVALAWTIVFLSMLIWGSLFFWHLFMD